MSNTVITWEQRRHITYGYVGKVRMFNYVYGIERGSKNPWQLRTSLPGLKKNTEHATTAACEKTAETMLRIHLNSLIKAGVEAPKADHIDAALDVDDLEQTAQAIARVAVRHEFEGFDEANWKAFWAAMTPTERLGYRLKAQAAMKA
jgi:hypothetical protein